jgi:hypothetical protein
LGREVAEGAVAVEEVVGDHLGAVGPDDVLLDSRLRQDSHAKWTS